MKCEECKKTIEGDWGIQVVVGGKSEFYYYCSEKHANKGNERFRNMGYILLNEETEVK